MIPDLGSIASPCRSSMSMPSRTLSRANPFALTASITWSIPARRPSPPISRIASLITRTISRFSLEIPVTILSISNVPVFASYAIWRRQASTIWMTRSASLCSIVSDEPDPRTGLPKPDQRLELAGRHRYRFVGLRNAPEFEVIPDQRIFCFGGYDGEARPFRIGNIFPEERRVDIRHHGLELLLRCTRQ